MDGVLPSFVMIALLFVFLVANDVLLWFSLQHAVTASSVTVYQCTRKGEKVEEMESSSSEIRIESDDENPESGEVPEGNVMSTKSYRRRERVNTEEMEGDAGLEI